MKRLVKLLTLAAVVAAVVAVLKRRPAPPSASPTAPPTPTTPLAASAPAPAEPTPPAVATPEPEPAATGEDAWAHPTAGGGCPEGYPVKAKLKSGIFHVPGGVLYERTVPDRCYASAEAAEADGLRRSLR